MIRWFKSLIGTAAFRRLPIVALLSTEWEIVTSVECPHSKYLKVDTGISPEYNRTEIECVISKTHIYIILHNVDLSIIHRKTLATNFKNSMIISEIDILTNGKKQTDEEIDKELRRIATSRLHNYLISLGHTIC